MRVTVLLAVHNGGDLVRGVVEDTLAQTYGDLELLVVDDASSDGTPELIESYGDPRFRVLRNERNIGQAPSLNRGLSEARGEYVARIDHDDRMLPTRIEQQVGLLDAHPEAALVGTWIDVVDERDRLWATIRGDIRDYVDFVASVLLDRYPFGHPSLMFRRDVVLGLGGYDTTLAPAEDKDLYRRLALARHEVGVVREPLVRYRRHEAQLSQVKHELQLRVDREGQERFLSALTSPDVAPQLRALLAEGAAPEGDAAALLVGLLEGARATLGLSTREVDRLEARLARALARKAVAAGAAGEPLLRWASRRLPFVTVLRPLLPVVPHARTVGGAARRASAHPSLRGIRAQARRSRLLRWLYARLG